MQSALESDTKRSMRALLVHLLAIPRHCCFSFPHDTDFASQFLNATLRISPLSYKLVWLNCWMPILGARFWS